MQDIANLYANVNDDFLLFWLTGQASLEGTVGETKLQTSQTSVLLTAEIWLSQPPLTEFFQPLTATTSVS
jgi:hypothetical protein